ncbi:hypothetical protein D5E83_22935 [Vibrio parahaemolyticus]|nr:hypothetical protein D5E83_22935 [Vibrio parahaemolyticus]
MIVDYIKIKRTGIVNRVGFERQAFKCHMCEKSSQKLQLIYRVLTLIEKSLTHSYKNAVHSKRFRDTCIMILLIKTRQWPFSLNFEKRISEYQPQLYGSTNRIDPLRSRPLYLGDKT